MADELWLKFDPEFHGICGHWDYSVTFFVARMMYRKQHEVINELWKKNRLGESFLFPYKEIMEYQPSKLEIMSHDVMNEETNIQDNLNPDTKTILPQPKIVQKIRWFNGKLNPEQKNAVINILKGKARPMPYVIYGPPGTGKTVTLTESIIQVYKEFPKSKCVPLQNFYFSFFIIILNYIIFVLRLLICAPTNSAVDVLLGKLISTGLFNNSIMKRLVAYNYYIGSSYKMEYDEYCFLPSLENSVQAVDNEQGNKELLIFFI